MVLCNYPIRHGTSLRWQACVPDTEDGNITLYHHCYVLTEVFVTLLVKLTLVGKEHKRHPPYVGRRRQRGCRHTDRQCTYSDVILVEARTVYR